MDNNKVFCKSKLFALRIINLYKHLCINKQEYILSKQILRSGTSIGANLAEAQYSISKKEFLSKVYISLKESVETQYWLEILHESNYITDTEFNSIYSDCIEIIKILTALTKTTKKSLTSQA